MEPAPKDKQASPDPLPELGSRSDSAITARSVTLGLLFVIFIAALTPYNDYGLNNTPLIGNNLPLGWVALLFFLVILVNAPLSRYRPRSALSSGELTVIFSMLLVGCALPSSGMMRYFPGSLVYPYWNARGSQPTLTLLDSMGLPSWLFPAMDGEGTRQKMLSPIIEGYYMRWISDGISPYGAWLQPAVAWGLFFAALFGAVLSLSVIVRRQWTENERLLFPLAQIQLALIEQPRPGRLFNHLFSRRSFWVAAGAVFMIRLWNGGAEYLPRYLPPIPLGFNFVDLFTEPPLLFTRGVRVQTIYFIAIGTTFFVSTSIAFSLWFFVILEQLYRITLGYTTGDPTHAGMLDEHAGGIIAFALMILWIGRAHWMLVLRQAFRGAQPGEPQGYYLSYAAAFWIAIGCAAVMVAWLILAGMTIVASVIAVSLLLMLCMMIARVVAETGLVYGQLLLPLYKPWQMLLHYGWGQTIPVKSFFLTGMLNSQFFDFREPSSVYATHALRLADEVRRAGGSLGRTRSVGRRFLGLLMLALMLSYAVSLSSMLWTQYNYASTQDVAGLTPVNPWGSEGAPERYAVEPTRQYAAGRSTANYSPIGHMTGGFVLTAILGYLRLQFAWWPLHPIGYIMLPTTPIGRMWFSIMLGWLCKVLVIRLGGAGGYLAAKPFFIGLIVGDSLAAAFWLLFNLVLSGMGVPFHHILIMPN